MAVGDIFTVDIDNGTPWDVTKNCTILQYMFPFQMAWGTDLDNIDYRTNRRNIRGYGHVYGVFLQNRSGSPNGLIAKLSMPYHGNFVAPAGQWTYFADVYMYIRDEDNWVSYPELNNQRRIFFTATIPGYTSRLPTCSLRLVLRED